MAIRHAIQLLTNISMTAQCANSIHTTPPPPTTLIRLNMYREREYSTATHQLARPLPTPSQEHNVKKKASFHVCKVSQWSTQLSQIWMKFVV